MKNYKNLKAFDADGDLSKRWYISYSYINPQTNEFERIRETGDINRYHTVKDRREALKELFQVRKTLLEKGFGPFEKYERNSMLSKVGMLFQTTDECIDKVLEHKKLHLRETSYGAFKCRLNLFKKFLAKQKLLSGNPKEITKKHIMDYLDSRKSESKISARTRNNELVDLKTLFNTMIDLDFIKENPAERVKKVRTNSEKNLSYEDEELTTLFKWIAENNPYLLVFCKFIYFSFLRPVEIVRLQIKDVDLNKMVINIPASKTKSGNRESVMIMDILKPTILAMNLDKYPPDYYVFSSKQKPDAQGTTRDYFTDKFKKAKDKLGLSINHTMYGLKHTGISHLRESGASEDDIRKHSRHTSTAFEAYTKRYEKKPARDLSGYFTNII
jgi:integrase